MALPITGILDGIVSHALTSGLFETVNSHEPKSPPGNGLAAAVWVDAIQPVRTSGLNSTSVRLTFNVRLYSSLLSQPEDAIDPGLVAALDVLMGQYSGDFTLGGLVRQVDLLGTAGVPMQAQSGYLNEGGQVYRVFTIVLPLIVNDLWDQEA